MGFRGMTTIRDGRHVQISLLFHFQYKRESLTSLHMIANNSRTIPLNVWTCLGRNPLWRLFYFLSPFNFPVNLMVFIMKSRSSQDAEFQGPSEKWAGAQLLRLSKARDSCGQTCRLESDSFCSVSSTLALSVSSSEAGSWSRHQADPVRAIRKVFLGISWQTKSVFTCCPERTRSRCKHKLKQVSRNSTFSFVWCNLAFSNLLHFLSGETAWPASIGFMTPE